MRSKIILSICMLVKTNLAFALPFELSVTQNNLVSVEVFGKSAITKSAKQSIEISENGSEKSECRDHGRAGSARAQSNVEIIGKDNNTLSLEMKSLVSAFGGHYRTCTTCIEKNCIPIFGNDTSSESTAKTSTTVKIHFNEDYPPEDYVLNVSHNLNNSSVSYALRDSAQNTLITNNGFLGPVLIGSAKDTTYFLTMEMPNRAFHKGEGGNDVKAISALIDIHIDKAPILTSKGVAEPYIVGGEQTGAYESVGALTINGKLHCTGTLITPKTILTAAHCLFGYENQIDQFRFLIGPNINQPQKGPYPIEGFIYPNGDSASFNYNPRNYEDDIGLIFLKNPIPVPVKRIHSGVPAWDLLIKEKTSLLFVGYGYDILQGEAIGLGIKREASWYINDYTNRTVSFKVSGKNTCKGDSGGPTFLETSEELIQVAITSTGSKQCDRGVQTRIDAYLEWLEKNIL